MSARRTAGIVIGVAGVLISVGHLVAVVFADAPERYHGHETVVVIGFVLTVFGLLLIGKDKQQ